MQSTAALGFEPTDTGVRPKLYVLHYNRPLSEIWAFGNEKTMCYSIAKSCLMATHSQNSLKIYRTSTQDINDAYNSILQDHKRDYMFTYYKYKNCAKALLKVHFSYLI